MKIFFEFNHAIIFSLRSTFHSIQVISESLFSGHSQSSVEGALKLNCIQLNCIATDGSMESNYKKHVPIVITSFISSLAGFCWRMVQHVVRVFLCIMHVGETVAFNVVEAHQRVLYKARGSFLNESFMTRRWNAQAILMPFFLLFKGTLTPKIHPMQWTGNKGREYSVKLGHCFHCFILVRCLQIHELHVWFRGCFRWWCYRCCWIRNRLLELRPRQDRMRGSF